MAESSTNNEITEPTEDTPDSDQISAENLQQFYYECFGDRDWDAYKWHEHLFLKRNIGYAIFGTPTDEDCVSNGTVDDKQTGYNKKQNKAIDVVYQAILNNHYLEDTSVILIRTIFITCELKNKKKSLFVEPVFVLKKCQNEEKFADSNNCKIFIDSCGRVYQSWELYLNNNKLPKCTMICPENGQYHGIIVDDSLEQVKVILESRDSPACSVTNKILNGADTAGTVLSVGTTLTVGAALIPGIVVAPALLTASAVGGVGVGIYSFGRSVQVLVDRKKHEQSIGLGNSESRWCWLNTTVAVLGASASAATGLLTRAVSKGSEISQAAKIAFNTLTAANIVGSATNLAFTGYNIIEKLLENERVTPLEIFQFASSILFFHHSVVNFRTANSIISETQSRTLLQFEETLRSNRHRKLFKKAQLEARRLKGEHAGNAEIISGMQNINDPNNFFAGLARINRDLNKSGARYTITADGRVEINSNYIVDPMEFANIGKDSRMDVLNNLPAYQQTPTTTTTSMSTSTFNARTNFITDCCQKLLANPQLIQKVIQEILNNKLDLQTITMLFKNYSETIVQFFLSILIKFLAEIKEALIEEFKKLHPMVSKTVGALQFLIRYVENLAAENQLDINTVLMSCFNHDNSVNATFIQNLVDNFQTWIKSRIEVLNNSVGEDVNRLRNSIKQKKECLVCNGHYYASV